MVIQKKSIFATILILIACITCSFLWVNFTRHPPVASVLISSYNMAETLPAALDSILNQTFSDFELIIIDDGSTDSSIQASLFVCFLIFLIGLIPLYKMKQYTSKERSSA